MDTRAHNRIAASLLPHVSKKVIEKVNHSIDNPSTLHYYFQSLYTKNVTGKGYDNPYDSLGLGKHSGHRRVAHDPLSASFVGYLVGGTDGVLPWFI